MHNIIYIYYIYIKMAKTRDDKFKLAYDKFLKDAIGIDKYYLKNLTRNKCENNHIYKYKIPPQKKVLGYMDKDKQKLILPNEITKEEITNMEPVICDYEPTTDSFTTYFKKEFNKFELTRTYPEFRNNIDFYIHRASYVDIIECELNENNELEGRLCVVYYKQHIPYRIIEDSKYFEKRYLMLRKDYNKIELELNETKDEVEEYTEERRQLLRKIRVLNRDLTHEQNTNIQNEENLQKKLKDAYQYLPIKEDCPVCYETIENKDTLYIPPCAHYVCITCASKCEQCPICRADYVIDNKTNTIRQI